MTFWDYVIGVTLLALPVIALAAYRGRRDYGDVHRPHDKRERF